VCYLGVVDGAITEFRVDLDDGTIQADAQDWTPDLSAGTSLTVTCRSDSIKPTLTTPTLPGALVGITPLC